jgi:hypothetical protein
MDANGKQVLKILFDKVLFRIKCGIIFPTVSRYFENIIPTIP